MLTVEQKEMLRSRLMKWKEELTNRIDETEHFGMDEEFIKESLNELSNYDNHPADHGTEEFERGKDLALNEHAEKELRDVTQALEAMQEGTYGICQVCHQEIPFDRLEALPTTQTCIDHAREKSIPRDRPVEEDVLRPPFGEFEYDEKDATLFDAEDSWQSVARYGTSETPSDFYDQSKLSYNDMYIESDEPVGFVEEIEGFIITDMEGNYIGVNEDHNKYESFLDDAKVSSIFGDHGVIGIDYFGEGEDLE